MPNNENFNKIPEFLTVKELQKLLRVSKGTVYSLLHSGELRAIIVGRQFRIPRNEFIRYISN